MTREEPREEPPKPKSVVNEITSASSQPVIENPGPDSQDHFFNSACRLSTTLIGLGNALPLCLLTRKRRAEFRARG